VGCRSNGINKQISYPKKNTWNPEEALLSLEKMEENQCCHLTTDNKK
jgi:hypothetical protein